MECHWFKWHGEGPQTRAGSARAAPACDSRARSRPCLRCTDRPSSRPIRQNPPSCKRSAGSPALRAAIRDIRCFAYALMNAFQHSIAFLNAARLWIGAVLWPGPGPEPTGTWPQGAGGRVKARGQMTAPIRGAIIQARETSWPCWPRRDRISATGRSRTSGRSSGLTDALAMPPGLRAGPVDTETQAPGATIAPLNQEDPEQVCAGNRLYPGIT